MDSLPMITLKVISQDNDVLFVKVNPKAPMLKLMKAYAKKKQHDYKVMQFFYDGDRIGTKQTPEKLLMRDGDEIEVFMHQTGGGGCEEDF